MFLFKIGSFRLRSIQDPPPPPSLYSPIGLLTDTTQGEAKMELEGIVDAVQTGQPLGLKRVKKDEGGGSAEENRKPTVPQNPKPGSVVREEQDVCMGELQGDQVSAISGNLTHFSSWKGEWNGSSSVFSATCLRGEGRIYQVSIKAFFTTILPQY